MVVELSVSVFSFLGFCPRVLWLCCLVHMRLGSLCLPDGMIPLLFDNVPLCL